MLSDFDPIVERLEHSRSHFYITGVAGTGKSTLLQYFRDHTKKNIVTLSPTGVAAVNIHGVTIHSFFGFPSSILTSKQVYWMDNKVDVFRRLDTIVLDEVSMVRADILDAIDISLRKHRSEKEPFGGVQMIMFGDLYQLSPIVTQSEEHHFESRYDSPYFFHSRVFQKLAWEKILLEKIYRQTDLEFLRLLNKVRNDQVSRADLELLNRQYNPKPIYADDTILLTGTNKVAQQENQSRLEKLPTKKYYYRAEVTGNFRQNSFPTDENLELKLAAQVMMIRNDSSGRWINGSIGHIDALDERSISVCIGGSVYWVERSTWEEIEYTDEGEHLSYEVVGTFKQFPLKLAWALTIHKSQGQTFNNVIIDLGGRAFSHGQTYVALSRCRTLKGIQLRSPLRITDIILDERVMQFEGVANV